MKARDRKNKLRGRCDKTKVCRNGYDIGQQ